MLAGVPPLLDGNGLEVGTPKVLEEFLILVHQAFLEFSRDEMFHWLVFKRH